MRGGLWSGLWAERRGRRGVAVVVVVAMVLAAVGVALLAWRGSQRTSYQQAVSWLPASTLRASWTDWSQVRALADGSGLGASASSRQVDQFLGRAYDRDLTSSSAVADSTYAMARRFGFSPLDAVWEMFGQSREGAVALLAVADSVDLAGLERTLRTLGYQPPADGSGSGGVWKGSPDLVAAIDPGLTPVLQNLVVLPEERLVLLSDTPGYAAVAAAAVTGDGPVLAEEVAGVAELADLVEEPASAVLFASDFACEALGLASADEEDRSRAEQLIAEAGGVSPVAGAVLALTADRSLRVGLHFETSEQARENVEPRVALASGEAVGQGGLFAERFTVLEGRSDGDQVVLELRPVDRDGQLLGDLAAGPLLFATC